MNKRDRQLQKLYDRLNESNGIVIPTKKQKKKIKKKNSEILKSNAEKYKKANKAKNDSKNSFGGLSYDELLKTPEWKKKRIEILIRDNRKCLVCNSVKNLHVHHRLYESYKLPWKYHNSYLATLCEKCHKSIHSSDINMKIMEYEITEKIGIVKK